MRRFFVILSILAITSSCNAVSSLVHDDQVVAKVGKAKLYKSEIDKLIPDLLSSEDSLALAARYIQSWALDQLYADVAEAQLSKSEMDIDAEMQAYRNSLIKYRYEQRYVSDRLDTLVTEEQIKEYYSQNEADFLLTRPVMKVRFINLMKDSPSKDKLLKLMSSNDSEELMEADTLARATALRYFDNSDNWMDARELAKAFGISYTEMLTAMKDRMIKVEPEGRGDLLAAYVCEIKTSGTAPLDYCSPKIHDILLSKRKSELLKSLEQDLLKDAIDNKKYIIY